MREELKEEIIAEVLASLNSRDFLKRLLQNLHQDQNLQLEDLLQLYREVQKEISIPLSIFSSQLNPLEALYSYLQKKHSLSNKEISQLLQRNEKSVWATLNRAKKHPLKYSNQEKYFLPISIFKNNRLTVLESVVDHLYQLYHLKNPQIAHLLGKSPNSIAVLHKRSREKNGSK